jgi:hypothetical protein
VISASLHTELQQQAKGSISRANTISPSITRESERERANDVQFTNLLEVGPNSLLGTFTEDRWRLHDHAAALGTCRIGVVAIENTEGTRQQLEENQNMHDNASSCGLLLMDTAVCASISNQITYLVVGVVTIGAEPTLRNILTVVVGIIIAAFAFGCLFLVLVGGIVVVVGSSSSSRGSGSIGLRFVSSGGLLLLLLLLGRKVELVVQRVLCSIVIWLAGLGFSAFTCGGLLFDRNALVVCFRWRWRLFWW